MSTLRELRKKAGLSASQVVERLNIHKNSIHEWENEKHIPRPETRAKLAELYSCTPDEVFESVRIAIKQVSKLQELREMAGLSVKRAAERLNCRETSIYKWERREHTPRMETCMKLSQLYKCTFDEIFNAVVKM